jgi:hypothetical protein
MAQSLGQPCEIGGAARVRAARGSPSGRKKPASAIPSGAKSSRFMISEKRRKLPCRRSQTTSTTRPSTVFPSP